MGDDLDLDAIEQYAASHDGRRDRIDMAPRDVLALIAALRRETERAEEANAALSLLYDDRDSWKARALAAEAGLREILHVASAVMMWTVGGDVDAPRALRAVCELAGKYEELRDRERSAQERGGEK